MRKQLTTVFALISAVFGVIVHLPDNTAGTLRTIQVGINEFSWIPALFGVVGSLSGLRRGSRLVGAAGLMGAGLALKPLWNFRWTVNDMESSMRAGLGDDYEKRIPAILRQRIAQNHWSLANSLGAREREATAIVSNDVLFSAPSTQPLRLDIYEPTLPPPRGTTYPAIIVLHWGSWKFGDKGGYFVYHNRYLASQGYVVFDIQYRLSDDAQWPSQIDDILQAVAWVREHARQYRVNTDKIALLGRSAGGHLALLAAYLPDTNIAVQAVVAFYPPTDLRLWHSIPDSAVTDFLGGTYSQKPLAYAEASPVEHVRDSLPPTLLIEAMMDALVPYPHVESLGNRLATTNTPHAVLRIPWARHGFDAVLSGLGAQMTQYYVDRFLAWSLYGEDEAHE
jgi:acetyl esterase/lipase